MLAHGSGADYDQIVVGRQQIDDTVDEAGKMLEALALDRRLRDTSAAGRPAMTGTSDSRRSTCSRPSSQRTTIASRESIQTSVTERSPTTPAAMASPPSRGFTAWRTNGPPRIGRSMRRASAKRP
jgi:hypothetical protein